MLGSLPQLVSRCIASRNRVIPGVILLLSPAFAAGQASVADSAAESGPIIRSMRDRAGISIERQLDELAKAPLPERAGSAGPVTVAAALATFRRITTVKLPPNAPANAAVLRAAAAVATHTNPPVAQAYLLEAERLAPGDVATRISMATLLIANGYPNEALALIGPSPPSPTFRRAEGIALRAGWLLTRGNALLCGNRPAEAVDPLREAGDEDPSMAEAARSLSKAHLMLGNKSAARTALRRASRQSRSMRWSRDGRKGDLPYAKLYDLSRGTHRELMPITPPKSEFQIYAFLEQLGSLTRSVRAMATEQVELFGAAVQAQAAAEMAAPRSSKVRWLGLGTKAEGDASLILQDQTGMYPLNTQWEPVEVASFSYLGQLNDYTPHIEEIARRDGPLSLKKRELIRTELSYMDVYPRQYVAWGARLDQLPHQDDLRIICRQQMRAVAEDLPNATALFLERDQAVREWFETGWKLASAIASHVPDGPAHDAVQAELETSYAMIEEWRLMEASFIYSRYSEIVGSCREYYSPENANPTGPNATQALLKCDPFLAGMNFTIKIPDAKGSALFELGVTCEKVSIKTELVELIPDILVMKSGLEWVPGARGGEITGLIGVSAGVPGLPFSVSSNVFITTNSSGAAVDGGIRTSLEQNISAGNESGSIESPNGTIRPEDVPGIVRDAVDSVKDLATGGGVQVLKDAVLYWSPGASPDA